MAAAVERKKRVPEVVVYSELNSSADNHRLESKKLSSKKNNILRGGNGSEFLNHNPSQSKQSEVDSRREGEEDDLFVTIDMQAAFNEVRHLCGEGLTGKKKRKYEEERAKDLGGKGHKPDVVPYPVYMKMQQRKREKEKEQIEDLKAQGMPLPKKKQPVKEFKGKGRWKDNLKQLDPHKTVGRVREGVLSVNQKTYSRGNKLSRPSASRNSGPQTGFKGRRSGPVPFRTNKGKR